MLTRPFSSSERFKYVISHIYVIGDTMGNLTLAIPDDVQQEMKHFSDIRWSEVARKAIIERLETLRLAEKLARKSRLTEKDVQLFSAKIKASATKRFLG